MQSMYLHSHLDIFYSFELAGMKNALWIEESLQPFAIKYSNISPFPVDELRHNSKCTYI